ncbi:MAG: nuclear transport factor 2 family protein [Chitinophagales bacterium]|nr:nuclear transport factor 2 family protein [Chitinophagales bacterium]
MKKQLFCFLLAGTLLAGACTQEEPKNPLLEVQAKNEAVVRQLYQHFNAHDWAKMAALYSDNAEFLDPSLGTAPVRQSHADVVKKYSELNGVFPDIHDDVKAIYPSGDKHVIAEFVSSGTAPDGSKFYLPICTVFTIENGVIVRDNTYYDNDER